MTSIPQTDVTPGGKHSTSSGRTATSARKLAIYLIVKGFYSSALAPPPYCTDGRHQDWRNRFRAPTAGVRSRRRIASELFSSFETGLFKSRSFDTRSLDTSSFETGVKDASI
jgi:hypothetical protein